MTVKELKELVEEIDSQYDELPVQFHVVVSRNTDSANPPSHVKMTFDVNNATKESFEYSYCSDPVFGQYVKITM